MRNTLLALSLVSLVAGSLPAFAADAAAEATVSEKAQTKLEMPAIKSRRKMLFSFGVFGTGLHVGWKKPIAKEDANGKFRGVGSPIFYGSVGTKALGLGTPKMTKYTYDNGNAAAANGGNGTN
jgi:hypothetical protein